MRVALLSAGVVCATLLMVSLTQADEAREKKLQGKIECGKCIAQDTETCQLVLLVKEGDKEVKYYLEKNEVARKYENKFCANAKEDVTILGTVAEKEGKKVLTARKISFEV